MLRYLLLGCVLCAPSAFAQQNVQLKPGAGLDAVTASCSVCHTLDYIKMNSVFLTPDAWKAEVAKMRGAYGAPIDDNTADLIEKYLAASYAARPKT